MRFVDVAEQGIEPGEPANTNHVRRRRPRFDPRKADLARAYFVMVERWKKARGQRT